MLKAQAAELQGEKRRGEDMRITTGEQLREVAAALKQDQRNYLHEVMQGQARIAELEAELAALKEIPEQIELAGYKASDGSLMSAESGAMFTAKHMDSYEPLITLAHHNAIVSSLRAKAAVPDGHALIPARIELSPEDIACIMLQCGGDEEATEIDEQFNGGVLWVGSLRDDDGSETYGLHIACVGYLEEGSTTIAEFAAAPAQPQIDGVIAPRELLERVAKPVLFTSQEDSHYDACTELRALLGGDHE